MKIWLESLEIIIQKKLSAIIYHFYSTISINLQFKCTSDTLSNNI